MIETWGTEIALVIAVLGTGLINLLLRKTEAMQHFSIRLLLRTCNTFTIVAVLLYGYLATKGANL
jgi:hypothetical protein